MLSEKELERYGRQISIDGFGPEGQQKLKGARVFLAGLGGLGSPAALYLAAAGVGYLRVVDSDKVELSNLNRQILHWNQDLGRKKVDSGASKLRQLNDCVQIEAIRERISPDNAGELVEECDLILDALDNLDSRYLLNRIAVDKNIPFCHGAIRGFEGRALTVIPGKSACLMCLYRGARVSEKGPVLGTTAGVIACIEATEAVKYITGTGVLLADRFLIYDRLTMSFHEIKIARDPACPHCGPGRK
jgi:molybdopterin/thiamine biosynthesis adenylyltransferase